MEGLATLFVTLVLLANTTFPAASIPKRLGVSLRSADVLSEDSGPGSTSLDETPHPATSGGLRFREARETKMEALEAAREARKEALERMKEERKKALEEAKERREEFKTRLEELRDEKKKEVVERIDENISKHNEKWVEHWNKVLSRLTEILAKIETRADKLAAEGKDISSVTSAVSAADAAIAAAQAAVDAQAGKTYVIEITDEEHLGENVSDVVKTFRSDVKGVIEKVQAARKAVHDAFKALKVLIKPEEEGASPSPTP